MMVDWKVICMPVILLIAWFGYHLSCSKDVYYYHVSNVIMNIKYLIQKIWSVFMRNRTECLGVVFQLAIVALPSFLLPNAHTWNASWIAIIATFAILCYCFKVCVEMKRAQLTRTFHYVNRRNNKKVWFFTVTHGLEFLLPMSYLLLAYTYFMELHLPNHHTQSDWEMVASAIKIFIQVLSGLLAVMGACKIYYMTPSDQNQVIPIQTIDNIPCSWNERILGYEMLPRDVENQIVADSNLGEVVQRDADNQSDADANLPEVAVQRDVENRFIEDATVTEVPVQRDVENQSIADPPEVAQRDYVEDQLYADGNVPAVVMDYVENQSVADSDSPEVVLRDDAENQSYANANVLEVEVHRNDVDTQSVADADPSNKVVLRDDAENQSYAHANVPEMAVQGS